MKVHLDTDIGGDIDDVCALAMLLKWSDLEITGITTVAEEHGRRAGYVRSMLELAGRGEIPLAAGADLDEGHFRFKTLGYPSDIDYWGEVVMSQPGPVDVALDLLKSSIEQGAIVVAIGPFTNLMLLGNKHPGILQKANLFLMGGYVHDIPPEYPQFSKHDDWNIQLDVQSARYVLEHAHPTLITLTVSCQTALRRANLSRLKQAGRLGQLVAQQAECCARDDGFEQKYGAAYPGVPDDIINFLHDPLACAIALGWRHGVEIETLPLRIESQDAWLYEIPDGNGIPTQVVTKIDGSAFNEFWLDTICR